MSIDTLNAYCGLWFVHCPCLAQGRFVIHPAELLALGISLSLVERVASSLTVRACVRSADSRVVCSAWVGVKLLRGSCSSLENLNFFIVLLFHDLRAGKVTRQI